MKTIRVKSKEDAKVIYDFEWSVPIDINEMEREWGLEETYELALGMAKIKIQAIIRGVLESGNQERIKELGREVYVWKPEKRKTTTKIDKAAKLLESLTEEEIEELLKKIKK